MKRFIFSMLSLISVCISINAQMKVLVNRSGGVVDTYLFNENTKITFSDGNITFNSPSLSMQYSSTDIKNVTFDVNSVTYEVGDVNKDGIVDNADVAIVANKILKRNGSTDVNCDVNNNGTVSIEDLTMVIDAAKNNVTHEYVDLGLSVKWATCNVGAETPEDYGDYYAWGEVETKSTYDWSTYKWCNGSSTTMTKYCTSSTYGTVDNKTILDIEDDVAHVKWGGSWRMPTKAEQDELRNTNNCTWTWTTQNGVEGYQVTSKKNGKSIFLPAAGYRLGGSLNNAGSDGDYWSSSLGERYSYLAYELYFNSGGVGWDSRSRGYGKGVRPVCP